MAETKNKEEEEVGPLYDRGFSENAPPPIKNVVRRGRFLDAAPTGMELRGQPNPPSVGGSFFRESPEAQQRRQERIAANPPVMYPLPTEAIPEVTRTPEAIAADEKELTLEQAREYLRPNMTPAINTFEKLPTPAPFQPKATNTLKGENGYEIPAYDMDRAGAESIAAINNFGGTSNQTSTPSINPDESPIRIIRGNFRGTGNAGTGGSFDVSDARVDKAGNYVEESVAPSVYAQQQAEDSRRYQAEQKRKQAIAEKTNPKYNKVLTDVDGNDRLVDGTGQNLGQNKVFTPEEKTMMAENFEFWYMKYLEGAGDNPKSRAEVRPNWEAKHQGKS